MLEYVGLDVDLMGLMDMLDLGVKQLEEVDWDNGRYYGRYYGGMYVEGVKKGITIWMGDDVEYYGYKEIVDVEERRIEYVSIMLEKEEDISIQYFVDKGYRLINRKEDDSYLR